MPQPDPPHLLRHAPELAGRVPWLSLARLPTPLESLPLQLPSGEKRTVLVKRDDLSGVPYGGNKVRKLEFILASARARGARRLITVGAAGSHHALATAVYGRATGLEVTLVLFPQPRTPHVRQVLLMAAATGAEIRWVPRMTAVPFGVAAARLRRWRDRPWVVPPGGSDAVGTLGYVNAGLELAGQLAAHEAERPARIHVASGTMGTAVGLALGLAMAGEHLPIHAVRITPTLVTNERLMQRLLERTGAHLRQAGMADVPTAAAWRMLRLRHDQVGRGYGRSTEAGEQAAAVFGAAGLVLDPTYTAKAAADLLASLDVQDAVDGPPPLFLHTLSAMAPVDAAELDEALLPPAFQRYLGGGLHNNNQMQATTPSKLPAYGP
jgi:1-aminocyclopropane-1-carboxylate deaminase/D-cysteine desulfhydrase-like pyridoxal-dependent ACC family enzyme